MRVLVVGATGVYGRHLVPRLLERKHQVRATVRRAGQSRPLLAMGADALIGDILDAASMDRAAEGCDAVVHIATALPRPGVTVDPALNEKVRIEGTRNLLAAALRAGVRRYFQQSIVSIYGDQGAKIATEEVPAQAPNERFRVVVAMEQMVRLSTLDWCILRGGSFYGPGTGREDEWRQGMRDGTLKIPGDGGALVSPIRVADMASGTVAAIENAPGGSIYNVVDDEPVTYRDLFHWLAAQMGCPTPATGGQPVTSVGCSNARLKDLGWHPGFPTYRSGLVV